MTPDKFLAIAEEAGVIVPVTRWIIQRVCRLAAEGPPHQFGYPGGAERRGHELDDRRVGLQRLEQLGGVPLHRRPTRGHQQHRQLRHPAGQVHQVAQ